MRARAARADFVHRYKKWANYNPYVHGEIVCCRPKVEFNTFKKKNLDDVKRMKSKPEDAS